MLIFSWNSAIWAPNFGPDFNRELCGDFFGTLRYFFVGVRWTLGCFFCGGQMDFGVLFLWGSDGLWGAFFVVVRWTLGCFFCGGQMDFGVLFLWGSDGLWGAFFVGVRCTLGCFFCGGQMDFGVLFLWGSDGLWGAFFVGVRWTLGCFFLLRLFSTEGTDGLGKKNLAGSLVFGVLFLWGSDGLWGAFFVKVRWALRCFFFVPVLNRQGFHLR